MSSNILSPLITNKLAPAKLFNLSWKTLPLSMWGFDNDGNDGVMDVTPQARVLYLLQQHHMPFDDNIGNDPPMVQAWFKEALLHLKNIRKDDADWKNQHMDAPPQQIQISIDVQKRQRQTKSIT